MIQESASKRLGYDTAPRGKLADADEGTATDNQNRESKNSQEHLVVPPADRQGTPLIRFTGHEPVQQDHSGCVERGDDQEDCD